MSEGNVPPRKNDSDSLDSAARADQTPANLSDTFLSGQDDWEIVPLAGMPALGNEASEPSPPLAPAHGNRDSELKTRIQDLNRCNEVLLTRVHQLEEALERSQQAHQQEMERSHRLTTEEKVAAAQNHSVAELLRDLEQANVALERQTILAETLSAQLQTLQERSEQLERECTVLRQQHSEKMQQLQVAEEACVDLRSRLQRQQRYTLQFKAALEKCLDTNAFHHASSRIEGDSLPSSPATESASAHLNPLVMPRSERIQPWSASEPAAHTDPHLLSLMRSHPLTPDSETAAAATPLPTSCGEVAPTPTTPATPASPDNTPPDDPAADANREAEQQLWQDVERVIDTTAQVPTDVAAAASANDDTEEAQFTEPIPWGAPVQKEASGDSEEIPHDAVADAAPAPSDAVAKNQQRPEPQSHPKPPRAAQATLDPRMPEPSQSAASAASIPALDAMKAAKTSPSPVVHPLRPTQRKRKSLSAVELPSFPPLPKVKN